MNFLKSIVFYPLLWLRKLFVAVGNFLAALFLILILFLIFAGDPTKENHMRSILFSGGMSFFFFMLTHFYDRLLLVLNPTGRHLDLEQ